MAASTAVPMESFIFAMVAGLWHGYGCGTITMLMATYNNMATLEPLCELAESGVSR